MQTYLTDLFQSWFPALSEGLAVALTNLMQILLIIIGARIISLIINRWLIR